MPVDLVSIGSVTRSTCVNTLILNISKGHNLQFEYFISDPLTERLGLSTQITSGFFFCDTIKITKYITVTYFIIRRTIYYPSKVEGLILTLLILSLHALKCIFVFL